MWIDAICINQFDDVEKSDQVRLMKTIYSKASKVIVWLGTGSKRTAAAFNLVRQFGDTRTEEERNHLWANVTSSWGWWRVQMELKRIVSHEWWSRAWIVQEIVVASHVVVRRGSAQLPYDTLQALLTYEPFQEHVVQSAVSADFADAVQQLRDERSSDSASPTTLFDLVYNFRHQLATLGSDMIYVLHGLLPPGCSTRVSPDYSKSPNEVFLDFTLASLAEDKTFSVVALAPGCALQGVSWCRDWRILNDGFGLSPFAHFSMYDVPLTRDYCATGNSEPCVEADLGQRVLKARGFHLDVIARRGECIHALSRKPAKNWSYLIRNWERIAGGPWSASSNEDLALSVSFHRTIVADRWPGDSVDWKTEIEAFESTLFLEEGSYAGAVLYFVANRRFFVTQNGKFGLGPWNLKAGDVLVAVLGSLVPLVLRQDDKSKRRQQTRWFETFRGFQLSARTSEMNEESIEEFWKVVGEAYCDGVMYYEGDIVKDIHDGKVNIEDYKLR